MNFFYKHVFIGLDIYAYSFFFQQINVNILLIIQSP